MIFGVWGDKHRASEASAKTMKIRLQEEVQQRLLEELVLEVDFGGYAEIYRVRAKSYKSSSIYLAWLGQEEVT